MCMCDMCAVFVLCVQWWWEIKSECFIPIVCVSRLLNGRNVCVSRLEAESQQRTQESRSPERYKWPRRRIKCVRAVERRVRIMMGCEYMNGSTHLWWDPYIGCLLSSVNPINKCIQILVTWCMDNERFSWSFTIMKRCSIFFLTNL